LNYTVSKVLIKSSLLIKAILKKAFSYASTYEKEQVLILERLQSLDNLVFFLIINYSFIKIFSQKIVSWTWGLFVGCRSGMAGVGPTVYE
jgi:hypothetical protein